jgi:hypothetical protein
MVQVHFKKVCGCIEGKRWFKSISRRTAAVLKAKDGSSPFQEGLRLY